MALLKSQKYEVNQYPIETILNWYKSKELAIPEIQRPFVWSSTQVRELIDSLYRGYPVGYLISWKDPSIKLKDGSLSEGKRILIDGQQRVTSLVTSVLKEPIVNQDYKKIRIQIAFNPVEEKFEVSTPIIEKDKAWISDIATIVDNTASIRRVTDEYVTNNPTSTTEQVDTALEKLRQIGKKQLGLIELDPGLDIDTVTTIFVRVNRTGVTLSQADFVMSKIASYGSNGEGSNLRKCIDYFCHLAITPEFYNNMKENDKEFAKTEYFQKISWLKNEKDDLYDPDYKDVLRVAFTTEFERGKLGDLVSLLSGRNFITKKDEPQIKENTFKKLEKSILSFVNQTNFQRFVMIIKSAGFIDKDLYKSSNVLNSAYMLYLKLKELNVDSAKIEDHVKKWFVMNALTGRYSGAVDSTFDVDIRNITKEGFEEYLDNIEKSELSDAFWDVRLKTELSKYNLGSSPYLGMFIAARIFDNDKGFLSKDISVRELVSERGDKHHIFPKNYLKKHMKTRREYNQLANLVYTQQEINVKIGDRPPKDYFEDVLKQCNGEHVKIGGITDMDTLKENLRQNCIPESIFNMTVENYDEFLEQRRQLMVEKIKNYYQKL